MRTLSTEGVLSTNPTVIIAATDAGPPEVVSALKASSVPTSRCRDDRTPEGIARKIQLHAAPWRCAAGCARARGIEHDFALLASQSAHIAKPIRALFVLTVQNGRAIVAGRGTVPTPSSRLQAPRTPRRTSTRL